MKTNNKSELFFFKVTHSNPSRDPFQLMQDRSNIIYTWSDGSGWSAPAQRQRVTGPSHNAAQVIGKPLSHPLTFPLSLITLPFPRLEEIRERKREKIKKKTGNQPLSPRITIFIKNAHTHQHRNKLKLHNHGKKSSQPIK